MKSTVQKSYEKNTLPNGEIEISFKKYPTPINVIILIGGCFILGAFFANSRSLGLLGWVVVPAYFIAYRMYLGSRVDKIFVTPNIGIRFNKDQLPFAELNTIGVNGGQDSAIIYAVSNGTEVNITRMLPRSLAEAIQGEIMQLSGKKWS